MKSRLGFIVLAMALANIRPVAAQPALQLNPNAPKAAESKAAGQQDVSAPKPPASRASLGVALSDNTRGGVLILRVLPGSAASAIGLQTGDRIMSIAGKPVANYRDVARIVSSYQPNARVQLSIDRGGWTKNMQVTLGNVDTLAVPVASAGRARALPPAPPAPSAVSPGSLLSRPYYQEESPADIDDQHGYGG